MIGAALFVAWWTIAQTPAPGGDGRYSIRNLPPGDYRILATADLEQGEWFDPAVLERLSAGATAFTITGTEKKTQDLVVR